MVAKIVNFFNIANCILFYCAAVNMFLTCYHFPLHIGMLLLCHPELVSGSPHCIMGSIPCSESAKGGITRPFSFFTE
jgi:hypothetical protein